MFTGKKWMALLAVAMLILGGVALAESVHQSMPGTKLYTGDGGNAVAKGQMETKKVEGAENGEVARVKGKMTQWGFVTCWFGIPAPEGKVIVRVRVYNEAGVKTAKYMLYTNGKAGQSGVGELKLPADAKENTFVNVDVPVNSKDEWSGLVIKKAEKNDLPSPWIDSVSVVIPD